MCFRGVESGLGLSDEWWSDDWRGEQQWKGPKDLHYIYKCQEVVTMQSTARVRMCLCVRTWLEEGGGGGRTTIGEPPPPLMSCLCDPQDIALHMQTTNTLTNTAPLPLVLLMSIYFNTVATVAILFLFRLPSVWFFSFNHIWGEEEGGMRK